MERSSLAIALVFGALVFIQAAPARAAVGPMNAERRGAAATPTSRSSAPRAMKVKGRTTRPTFGPTRVERQWRLGTRRSGIRVFRPKAKSAAEAVVLYVHGYGATVDDSWRDHRLVDQFRKSGKNAVFVSVEAPAGPDDTVRFRRLDRVLARIERRLGRALPKRVIAMGHSGAYRTLLPWLRYGPLRHVVLLDCLYSTGRRFGAWLRRHPARRLTAIYRGRTPSRNSRWLAKHLGKLSVKAKRVPRLSRGLTARQRRARALFIHAQYSHLGIITSGRTIPLIVRDRL